MNFLTDNLVLSAGLIITLFITVIYIVSIFVGKESIFRESGVPISMAQALLSSLHVISQVFFGILAILLIAILMEKKIVSSDAGLPILSAIAAYLLGKSYKDINFKRESKTRDKESDED